MIRTAGPAVWMHTFGCKANQYDTERMRQELESRGARVARTADQAQVAVVNTCTVTNQADADARALIRRLRRANPELRIVVAGCSAALQTDRYGAMPEVDAVVAGQDPVAVSDAAGSLPQRGSGVPRLLELNRRGTRAWLKIQDGCDRRCSFCATRLARGASRSRSAEEIVAEARLLARHHPEIVLTGIHIGHYGLDLTPRLSLSRLCARLLEQVPEARIRLSSIEATEIDDLMVDLFKTSAGALAPHLHVPLQSGSDPVLRRMRRWHTRDAYRERVISIAERLPRLGLGADIIVGFPGETEAEYQDTYALVRELPYTYLHVFPFSVRDGTEAASLPGRVRGDVSAVRARRLRELGLAKGRAYRAARVGQAAKVVLEGGESVVRGLTGDYLRVDVDGDGLRPGQLVDGRLEGDPDSLRAQVLSSHSPPSTTKMAPVIQSPAGDTT